MTLVYRLALRCQQKHNSITQNANFLSLAGPSDSVARTKPPALCELPPGLGRRHRLGTGRRGPMGVARSRRTSPPPSSDPAAHHQSQSPQVDAEPHHNHTICLPSPNRPRFPRTKPQRASITTDTFSLRDKIQLVLQEFLWSLVSSASYRGIGHRSNLIRFPRTRTQDSAPVPPTPPASRLTFHASRSHLNLNFLTLPVNQNRFPFSTRVERIANHR